MQHLGSAVGLRLQTLAYLDAVVRVGTFGDAADELGVSQPALSQGIGRLEQLLGVELFVADGRLRRLTAEGALVADYAAKMLADTSRLLDTVTARRDGVGGVLRVGMIDAAALYLLSDAVDAYRRAHPAVDLRLTIETSRRLVEALHDHQLDLALVIAPARGVVTPVLTESLYVYGDPIADLADADSWALYPEGSHTRHMVDDALVGLGIDATVTSESGNPSILAQLVRLGRTWTVLPAGIAESGPEPLNRLTEAVAERQLVAVRRSNAEPDPLRDDFLDAMLT